MNDSSEVSTARQVHNGLVGIIGWLQLLRRRINAGSLDQEQIDQALIHIESISRDTERMYSLDQELQRNEAEAVPATELDSSVVSEVGYGLNVPVLSIHFQNGRVYHYYDVPDDVHQGLMASESKGRYFNSEIRNRFPFKRVESN